MSEAGNAVATKTETKPQPARGGAGNRITELRVSGHLMTLEDGTFCVFQPAGSPNGHEASGLPGVRVSLPPGPASRPEAVTISTFRDDGWLNGAGSAALVKVAGGPAQVLVTVYQAQDAKADAAPRLQVLRLSPEPPAPPALPVGAPPPGQAAMHLPDQASVLAHIQRSGDVPGRLGEWMGKQGSRAWIEGFAIAAPAGLAADDLEYQALLGRDWLSPWVEAGKFCGSRGMALPLLGLALRLKGKAAERYSCFYSASFVDGSSVGPVSAGTVCSADSLAALEAFQVVLHPVGGAVHRPAASHRPAPKPVAKIADKPAAKPAAKAAAKPMPKSVAKPAARPAPKPAVKLAAKRAAKPAAKPVRPAPVRPAPVRPAPGRRSR